MSAALNAAMRGVSKPQRAERGQPERNIAMRRDGRESVDLGPLLGLPSRLLRPTRFRLHLHLGVRLMRRVQGTAKSILHALRRFLVAVFGIRFRHVLIL